MEIEKEITKEVFERYCPAAKSPARNTSVYDRVLPIIKQVYDNFILQNVGDDYKDKLEGNAMSKKCLMCYVCNNAFYRAISSLDLVLTGTGFGIVNTNDTSPASQTRVQALKDDTEWIYLSNYGYILTDLTKIDGWGETRIAKNAIDCLYWNPYFIYRHGDVILGYTRAQTWGQIKTLRHTPEMKVQMEISHEYYETLLTRIRTYALTEFDEVMLDKILTFEHAFINALSKSMQLPEVRWAGLRDYMEQYIDQFPTYKASKLYAYLHGEKYENKQEDPTFFFTV